MSASRTKNFLAPGPGLFAPVNSAELLADATEISVDRLDLNTYKEYFIVFGVKNAIAGTPVIGLYCNADNTGTNYWRQNRRAQASSNATDNQNSNLMLLLASGGFMHGTIRVWKGIDSKARMEVQWVENGAGVNSLAIGTSVMIYNVAVNVVRLALIMGTAGAMGVGSFMKVYRVGRGDDYQRFTADGAISILDGSAELSKASAAAMTLAAPTARGIRKEIFVGTDFPHVVTATGLIAAGVAGGLKNTITFDPYTGAGITLISNNALKWSVLSKNGATIT